MSKISIAFYKRKRPRKSFKDALFRLCDDAIKFFTKSKYSHCEIAIPIKHRKGWFYCYSSSNMDGGVRRKEMYLDPEHWDLIEVSQDTVKLVKNINELYQQTEKARYDLIGALGVVLRIRDSKSKYFCSEWCAEALKLAEPQRYSPGDLYNYLITRGN